MESAVVGSEIAEHRATQRRLRKGEQRFFVLCSLVTLLITFGFFAAVTQGVSGSGAARLLPLLWYTGVLVAMWSGRPGSRIALGLSSLVSMISGLVGVFAVSTDLAAAALGLVVAVGSVAVTAIAFGSRSLVEWMQWRRTSIVAPPRSRR